MFNDLWTAERVETSIFADPAVVGPDVGWIAVGVEDGTVVLRGSVAERESVRRAAAAARAAGSRSARNELTARPRASEALPHDVVQDGVEKALRHESHLAGSTIQGRVQDGIVRLTGRVPDIPARALASRTARRVPGVKAVENNLWPERLAILGGR